MGTRADFYVAKDGGLDWRGSIAWDGYPEGIDSNVLTATTAEQFDAALDAFFSDNRDDVTRPADGWPWPWDNSRTTDFAYVLIEGEGVVFSTFGRQPYWARRIGVDGDNERADITLAFPDMTDRKNVKLAGPGSGTIVIAA